MFFKTFLQTPNISDSVFVSSSHKNHSVLQEVLYASLHCFLAFCIDNAFCSFVSNQFLSSLFRMPVEFVSFSLKSNFLKTFFQFRNIFIAFFLFIACTPFVMDSFSRIPNYEVNFCSLLLVVSIFFHIA